MSQVNLSSAYKPYSNWEELWKVAFILINTVFIPAHILDELIGLKRKVCTKICQLSYIFDFHFDLLRAQSQQSYILLY